MRKCCGCLSIPLIDLSVQGEVIGDGGAKICELLNDVQFAVIDGDGWQFDCILPQEVCLLQTDGLSEILAGKKEMVIYTDGSFSMDLLSNKAEEQYITTMASTKVLANLRKQ